MKDKNYQSSITTSLSPEETMLRINQVSKWWAKDFEGESEDINDVFTIRFKSGDTYTCKVTKIIPSKKIVWDVIDSYQGWNSKPTEWNGTQIIWEITSENDNTLLQMTHIGLIPEFECFSSCRQGWDYLVKHSLQKLLNENEGVPV